MFYNGSPVDALLELIVELSAAHEIGDVFLKWIAKLCHVQALQSYIPSILVLTVLP